MISVIPSERSESRNLIVFYKLDLSTSCRDDTSLKMTYDRICIFVNNS